ncbi:ATP-binding protein [Streptomyces scopuliridis]|uniref:ATP-binding protein n=1 Tax=Streptomyces scopuliridis TaxID=452529 RepID=UPI0036CC4CE5
MSALQTGLWREFPGDTLRTARDARRFVTEHLTALAAAATAVDTAVQIVSELAANAVEHASGDRIRVSLVVNSGGHLTLTVTDQGIRRPADGLVAHRAPVTAEGGRGLDLVEQLALGWGWYYSTGRRGMSVWAKIALMDETS